MIDFLGATGEAAKEEAEAGEAPPDTRDTYVLGPSQAGLQGSLYGRPLVGGMRTENSPQRQPSLTSEVSSAAPSRQISSAGSRQVSSAGEHEYDEEQYKKISLTRSSASGTFPTPR